MHSFVFNLQSLYVSLLYIQWTGGVDAFFCLKMFSRLTMKATVSLSLPSKECYMMYFVSHKGKDDSLKLKGVFSLSLSSSAYSWGNVIKVIKSRPDECPKITLRMIWCYVNIIDMTFKIATVRTEPKKIL